jgi:hypothetical protein
MKIKCSKKIWLDEISHERNVTGENLILQPAKKDIKNNVQSATEQNQIYIYMTICFSAKLKIYCIIYLARGNET